MGRVRDGREIWVMGWSRDLGWGVVPWDIIETGTPDGIIVDSPHTIYTMQLHVQS
jgi:hypothetical protein